MDFFTNNRVQRIHSSGRPYKEKPSQGKWIILLCLTAGRVQNGRRTSKNSEILWTLDKVEDNIEKGENAGHQYSLFFFL